MRTLENVSFSTHTHTHARTHKSTVQHSFRVSSKRCRKSYHWEKFSKCQFKKVNFSSLSQKMQFCTLSSMQQTVFQSAVSVKSYKQLTVLKWELQTFVKIRLDVSSSIYWNSLIYCIEKLPVQLHRCNIHSFRAWSKRCRKSYHWEKFSKCQFKKVNFSSLSQKMQFCTLSSAQQSVFQSVVSVKSYKQLTVLKWELQTFSKCQFKKVNFSSLAHQMQFCTLSSAQQSVFQSVVSVKSYQQLNL